jgi:hypothetical protein
MKKNMTMSEKKKAVIRTRCLRLAFLWVAALLMLITVYSSVKGIEPVSAAAGGSLQYKVQKD